MLGAGFQRLAVRCLSGKCFASYASAQPECMSCCNSSKTLNSVVQGQTEVRAPPEIAVIFTNTILSH